MATSPKEHWQWIEGLFEAITKDLIIFLSSHNISIPSGEFIGPNTAKYFYITSGEHFINHMKEYALIQKGQEELLNLKQKSGHLEVENDNLKEKIKRLEHDIKLLKQKPVIANKLDVIELLPPKPKAPPTPPKVDPGSK